MVTFSTISYSEALSKSKDQGLKVSDFLKINGEIDNVSDDFLKDYFSE